MPGLDVRIELAAGDEGEGAMDSRRGPRFVIDPKVRQVGFVTPGSESENPNPNSSAVPMPVNAGANSSPNANADSPSPVFITPRLPDPPARTTPLPVPSPPPRKQPSVEIPLQGSYNPADSVLGNSPALSPASNGRYTGVPSSEGPDLSPSASRMSSGIEILSLREDHADSPSASRFSTGGEFSLFKQQQQQHQQAPPPVTRVYASSLPPQPPAQILPPTVDKEEPSKPLKERTTKAERRAKQEADREAKRAARESGGKVVEGEVGPSGGSGKSSKAQVQKKDPSSEKRSPAVEKAPEKEKKKEVPAPRMQFDDEHRVAKAKKRSLIEQTETKNRVELFRHLPQFVHGTQLPSLEAKFFHDDVMHPHPAVYQVGLQYLTGDISGGNARCVAMLLAFKKLIQDYSTPKEKTLVRDLTARVNSNVSFLTTCRPLSISMGNAIKFLKTRIANLQISLSESDAKSRLIFEIDRFIQYKIDFADKEITKHAVTKIKDGDVLLTYASSCVVEMIILCAFELGRKFRVVIVDSRPKLEGKGLLRRLLGRGISCTYTHINAVSYIMQEVTKVFLGASSILSNGTVYSRVGSAAVAMVANAFHVPVMVCCETYKFHERVQLDSICFNELGDPDALVKVPGKKDPSELEGWSQNSHLQLLNLTYDATPADYVSMIITELGMVPPTSVPVILREYRKEPIV
ncbi:hypothetical protein GOP47_0022768 [Adiantum capillus-veneris]|uniref:Translation initiation factor eIF2B subunit delta n=1 Tax=Adiantum capillus-veneris TaxID=13818 RepID=A0A9D4Z5N0_ADICA|nr:hypothetical protein GOP47_0022768 [Adiantum capillus-veneris]